MCIFYTKIYLEESMQTLCQLWVMVKVFLKKNKGIGLVAVMIVIINMDNFCQYQYSCSDFGVKICRFDDKCFFLSQETDKILPICNFV